VVTANCSSRWANLARIQPLPVGLPTANHLPRRRPSPSRPSAGPARACASFERQALTSGRGRAVMDMAGDHADPAIPAVRLAAPPPHPATSFPSDTADAGRTDAGGRTLDTGRSDGRTGHRSRGQAPVGHRTLAPDTGHRMPDERGHRDDSTAGIRIYLAATPSDRTLRPATVLMLSHNQPAARPPRRPSGASAHCSPQTNFRVERRANGEASSVMAGPRRWAAVEGWRGPGRLMCRWARCSGPIWVGCQLLSRVFGGGAVDVEFGRR
jgi:hypothetical protein